jgi:hypothetical protein
MQREEIIKNKKIKTQIKANTSFNFDWRAVALVRACDRG